MYGKEDIIFKSPVAYRLFMQHFKYSVSVFLSQHGAVKKRFRSFSREQNESTSWLYFGDEPGNVSLCGSPHNPFHYRYRYRYRRV